MQWFIEFREVVAFFVPYLNGAILALVINWLKGKLNLEDRWAWIMTLVLSLIVGLLSLVADGQLNPEALRIDNAAELVIAAFTTSSVIYFKILRKESS